MIVGLLLAAAALTQDAPTLYVLTGPNCPPCERMHADVGEGDPSLKVKYADGTGVRGVRAYPTIYNPVTGETWTGYHNLNGLKTLINKPATAPTPEELYGYPVRDNLAMVWVYSGGRPYLPSVSHLSSGEHAGKFDLEWLKTLSQDDLNWLHTHDHYNRVDWRYAKRGNAQVKQVRTERRWMCINGKCGWYTVTVQ